MNFVPVHCQHCRKLIGEASDDFLGLVRLKCRHCKALNTISLALILKELRDDDPPAIIPFPQAHPPR